MSKYFNPLDGGFRQRGRGRMTGQCEMGRSDVGQQEQAEQRNGSGQEEVDTRSCLMRWSASKRCCMRVICLGPWWAVWSEKPLEVTG